MAMFWKLGGAEHHLPFCELSEEQGLGMGVGCVNHSSRASFMYALQELEKTELKYRGPCYSVK
jgi:hypothetical protein